MITAPSLITRAPEHDRLDGDSDIATFLFEVPPTRGFRHTFIEMWDAQSGERSDPSRPQVRFGVREVSTVLVWDTLEMDVTGLLDSTFGPDKETAPAYFKRWVELYIDYTNDRLAKLEAEKQAREAAEYAARKARLARINAA